jgi:multiple sugar transport system permease protein/arabinosaccharide transport system permease protein
MSSLRFNRILATFVVNGLLLFGVYLLAVPYIFMIASTFKPNSELFALPVRLLPQSLNLENYQYLFNEYPFWGWYWNTAIITVIRTILAIFFSALAGFALAKYDFRFKKVILLLIIISLMLPFQVLLTPLFIEMAALGWLDTNWGVIAPSAVSAFFIFLMRQYMLGVPNELLDAARIDGCSEFGLFWRVVAPVQQPAFAVVGILAFTGAWTDYLWPLIVLQSSEKFVLNIGIASMIGPYRVPYGAILAGSFLATLPVVIFFLIMQRQFIAGLTAGALKE